MHRLRVLISLLVVLAAWQFVVWLELVPVTYLPGPLSTAHALWLGLLTGELAVAWLQTAVRVVIGIVASSLLGVGLALVAARYGLFRRAVEPFAEFLRPLPPAALVPTAIFFLGLDWKLYGFIVLFACIWPVYLNASQALRAVPHVQLHTAAAFGYTGWNRVLQVQLPASMPDIFTGIRIASGIALIAVIVAEMLAGRNGLGFVLNDTAMTLRIPETFATLLLLMLTGLLLGKAVILTRDRFIAWHIGLTAANQR